MNGRFLSLAKSGFSGTIPTGIFKLKKLIQLNIEENQFKDAGIPNAISNLVKLTCVWGQCVVWACPVLLCGACHCRDEACAHLL